MVFIIISQTKSKDVAIEVEFELFYQGLLRNLTHILDNELTLLKTKLRSTCETYSKIIVPHKFRKIIDSLSKKKHCGFKTRQRKRRLILDTTKYTEKCMALLNTEHFKNVITDATAATDRKIKKVLRKIKSKFSEQECKRLYPTG